MKNIYRLEDLDCAACAAKIEKAINDLPEVDKASVSFMTQKLTLESEVDSSALLPKIRKIIKKIEPDCRLCES